jgi:hypothetical protein
VAGNHDYFAVKKIPFYNAGFDYPKNWYSLTLSDQQKLSNDKLWLYESDAPLSLKKENIRLVRNFPEYKIITIDNMNILLSHYAYPDLIGTTKFEHHNIDRLESHFRFMKSKQCDLSISGHDDVQGCEIYTENTFLKSPFGELTIPSEPCWIKCPSVARGNYQNGVVVFETQTKRLQSILLIS